MNGKNLAEFWTKILNTENGKLHSESTAIPGTNHCTFLSVDHIFLLAEG